MSRSGLEIGLDTFHGISEVVSQIISIEQIESLQSISVTHYTIANQLLSLLSSDLSVILLLDSFRVKRILLGDLTPSYKGEGASSPWPTNRVVFSGSHLLN